MTGFIENAATVSDVAKALGTTPAAVEAEALELDLFVGENWAGAPAVSTIDAAGLVSGDARRAHDARAAWLSHESALEAHETEREAARVAAFTGSYDAGMRRGVGAAAATEAGHTAARDAVRDFDATHPVPTFGGAPTTLASWLTKTAQRVKVRAGS